MVTLTNEKDLRTIQHKEAGSASAQDSVEMVAESLVLDLRTASLFEGASTAVGAKPLIDVGSILDSLLGLKERDEDLDFGLSRSQANTIALETTPIEIIGTPQANTLTNEVADKIVGELVTTAVEAGVDALIEDDKEKKANEERQDQVTNEVFLSASGPKIERGEEFRRYQLVNGSNGLDQFREPIVDEGLQGELIDVSELIKLRDREEASSKAA